jgi:Protein of unknown function (DUF3999)
LRRAALVGAGALVLAAPAAAAGVDRREFRYERVLRAPAGGPIAFQPDGPLYGHADVGFPDLRIVDGKGEQVPWRSLPEQAPAPPEQVRVLDSGRRGGQAVALLDLGPGHRVHDRVDLGVTGQGFVGRATVLGSDDRRTFTSLGSTRIFDLAGAGGRVRSTVVTFAPSDFRYLELRATGVRRIVGATVSGKPQRLLLRPVAARVSTREAARRTVLLVDVGYSHMPVDRLRLTALTARYDRSVEVEERDAGEQRWTVVASGRIFRYYGRTSPALVVGVRARRLRITVSNGDDPPLRGLRVEPLARPERILVEGGHPVPLELLYGGRARTSPDYDYGRLPRDVLGLDRLRRGSLGPESLNHFFETAPDTRTFVKKHPALVDAALAVAAAMLGLGGFLALRRRA